ncbi:hypothetical protein CN380_14780 [Bacillus sp. AFS017274]|jgi:hypothetical protein|nr:hypothetical protein CN380_14780 [Bacillus sp. AFS017274]
MSTGVVLIFHFKLISQSMIKVILDTNIKVTNKNIAILYLDLFGALLAFKKNMVNIIMIIKKNCCAEDIQTLLILVLRFNECE